MSRLYLDKQGLQTFWADVDQRIAEQAARALNYRGTVATYADLPANPLAGDMYNVVAAYGDYPAGSNFAWTGTEWDALGGMVDLSRFATKDTATQSANGLMSSSDKAKLDGVEANANNYSLPTMSASTAGGAKLGSGLEIEDGALSIDLDAIAGWGLAVEDGRLRVSDSLRVPQYDEAEGRYSNASIKAWLDSGRDGLVYSVLVPRYSYSTSTTCTKADANVGLVCEPSTSISAGRDDYRDRGPFETWEVNGGADADGSPFTTAFKDVDSAFSRHGENGDVWMMRRVLWYRYESEYSATHARLSVCDTERDGFSPQPGAKLPDGTMRPYMLYSKYAGCMYGGKYASVSGQKAQNRNISHDSLIGLCAAKGAGYSGKSIAHDFIDKVDFLLIYASKSSQAVFAGCTGYTLQCAPTVAETGVRRVIVGNANAAAIDVGSAMQFGTHTGNNDRGTASNYDIFDGARVTKKEAYDANNTAVYFDTANTFDTATGYYLSTTPWPTGALDSVQGLDGTITAAGRTNSHEPFLLRGRECMVGFYEVLSGVIINAAETDGELVCELHVAYDTADDATSLTSGFVDTGVSLPTSTAAGWLYACDISDAGGLLVGTGHGASTSTGTGDGTYQNVATSKGLREFRGLGLLGNGGLAGLLCVASDSGLGGAGWNIGSRLSATGRSGVN